MNANETDVPTTWRTWVFAFLLLLVVVGLIRGAVPMFSILILNALILFFMGLVDSKVLFEGLVNNAVLSIALLCVLVHPLVELPLIKSALRVFLGQPPSEGPTEVTERRRRLSVFDDSREVTGLYGEPLSEREAIVLRVKLTTLSLITSPFLENTPQVAMLTPLVAHHCRTVQLPPSQVLMPLAFAVILGNAALLGAASSLVVSGVMESSGLGHMPFFELAKVVLPLYAPIVIYMALAPPYLLPKRRGGITFFCRLKVASEGPLVGERLGDVLMHFVSRRREGDIEQFMIERHKTVRGRVSVVTVNEPRAKVLPLEAGDTVDICGLVSTLLKESDPCAVEMRGAYIPPSSDEAAAEVGVRLEHQLHSILREAVRVARTHTDAPPSLANEVADFSRTFGVLLLTLKVSLDGKDLVRDEREFGRCPNIATDIGMQNLPALLRKFEGSTAATHPAEPTPDAPPGSPTKPPSRWRERHILDGGKLYSIPMPFPISRVCPVVDMPWWWQYLSLPFFVGVIVATALDVSLSVACLAAVVGLVLLGILDARSVVRSLPMEVVMLVGFSFPLGTGMVNSGLATFVGHLMSDANLTGFWLLMLVGAVTVVLTNLITTQGCVQVILPIVIHNYRTRHAHPLPGIMMVAASCCFALITPFAIPPNAIVLEPGGYRGKDYVKFGTPLAVLLLPMLAVAVAAIYDDW